MLLLVLCLLIILPRAVGQPGNDEVCPIVIDARTEAEWQRGHLECAHRVELAERSAAALSKIECLTGGNMNARVVIYCASGNRVAKERHFSQTRDSLSWKILEV